MKLIISPKKVLLFTLMLATISCSKTGEKSNQISEIEEKNAIKPITQNELTPEKLKSISMEIFGNTEFKMSARDNSYINSVKKLAVSIKSNATLSRIIYGDTSFYSGCELSLPRCGTAYGYYDDSEDFIVEGQYIAAATTQFETEAQQCPTMDETISAARQYLTEEGYDDIVRSITRFGEDYKLIHAANALIDLKSQMGLIYEEELRTTGNGYNAKLANCVLQAIGYAAIAEMGANWAAASRQAILKAVGKLATRYLGWFGAAIAVISFVDCMWG